MIVHIICAILYLLIGLLIVALIEISKEADTAVLANEHIFIMLIWPVLVVITLLLVIPEILYTVIFNATYKLIRRIKDGSN